MVQTTARILGDYNEYSYGYTKIVVSICVENNQLYVRMTRVTPKKNPRSFAIPLYKTDELLNLLTRENKKGCFLEYSYGSTFIEVHTVDVNGVSYVRITRNHPTRKPRSLAVPIETLDGLISLLNMAKEAA